MRVRPAGRALIDLLLSWRERLTRLVFGSRTTLEQSARAVIAFGGLQDCCLQFPDAPHDALKRATVAAGMAALGL